MEEFRRTWKSMLVGAVSICTLVSQGTVAFANPSGAAMTPFIGCPADLTEDGSVDMLDVRLMQRFLQTQSPRAADLNQDGVLDNRDTRLVYGMFGKCKASADLDSSGAVDGLDLALLLGAFEESAEDYVQFDLDHDGIIGDGDVQALLAAWGPLVPLSSKLADIDGDQRITKCDLMLSHPRFGARARLADVNRDGRRDTHDYSFVAAYKIGKGVIIPFSNPREARRCKAYSSKALRKR